ncbi:hypothetical protein BC834DRAFT_888264 [Gloeopeniophorella convolvens]|nr:hypothetical protein BC834DRAFT_888264 [Gloeopeniophorella convolvens]
MYLSAAYSNENALAYVHKRRTHTQHSFTFSQPDQKSCPVHPCPPHELRLVVLLIVLDHA